ncbi:MAG: hypothetical protein WC867_01860 [Candidatus Pacearchaeota archaeon]|jgi:hypothetical protein
MKNINWKNLQEIEKPFCHICKKDTKFFSVPDKEWFNVVPENLQDKVLCLECYKELKKNSKVI